MGSATVAGGWGRAGGGAADGGGEATVAVDGGVGCTDEVGVGPAARGSDLSRSTIHATVLATAIMTTPPATTIPVIRAGVSRCVDQSSRSSSDHAVCASVSSTAEPSSVGAAPVGAASSPSSPISRCYRGRDSPSARSQVGVWTVSTPHRIAADHSRTRMSPKRSSSGWCGAFDSRVVLGANSRRGCRSHRQRPPPVDRRNPTGCLAICAVIVTGVARRHYPSSGGRPLTPTLPGAGDGAEQAVWQAEGRVADVVRCATVVRVVVKTVVSPGSDLVSLGRCTARSCGRSDAAEHLPARECRFEGRQPTIGRLRGGRHHERETDVTMHHRGFVAQFDGHPGGSE